MSSPLCFSPLALRRSIRLATLALTACSPLFVQAQAIDAGSHQQVTRSYQIPAGPLSAALSRFAAEAGVLLSVDARLTAGKQSPGLQGEAGVDEGFVRLLQGSGLQVVADGSGGYSLEAAAPTGSASLELESTDVRAFALGNALGSMDGYNATHSSVSTKTSKALAQTAQSVSVVTREQIERQGALTAADAMRYSPGVLTNPYGNTHRYDYLAIRGINDGSVDNITIDGLKSMGDPGSYSSLQIDPYFIERIDILKGPSSVLYGRSNPGGLAAISTKRPDFTQSGRVDLSYGNNARKSLGFDVTGPLSENVAYRVVGLAKDADAQADHVTETRYALMPSLALNLSDDTFMTLYAYLQDDPNGGYHGSLPASGTVHKRDGRRISSSFFEGDPALDEFTRTQQMLGYELEHRFNDTWSARQNFRYLDARVSNSQVWGSGYVSGNQLRRGYSGGQEQLHAWIVDNMLQADFATGAAQHTLVLGLDYQYSKNKIAAQSDTAGAPIDVFDPVQDYGDLTALRSINDALRRQKQTGLYLQDLVEIDNWNLSFGLRQDWYDVSIDDEISGKDDNQGEKLSGHVGVLYAFDNGLSPYVSYSTSFNPTSNYSSGAQILDPTTGEQWEAGLKFQPPGTDDLYTLSFFNLEMENLYAKENSLVTDSFYKGVGGIRSRGVELEARFKPVDNLQLIASYTYADVSYSKSYFVNDGAAVVDAKGNTPPQTPERMASLWADYRFSDGALAGLTVGAGARYVGHSEGSELNDFNVPSYTLFDASVGYDLSQVGLKGTSLQLTASNLTDEYYVASCYSAVACYLGEERTVTATVTQRF
ncbi:ferrioxamine receptor FoxA [Pseudomonas straminea]|uniref:Iron complex outermembrane recepter protein n=1 Tax=Pseudomonas straminea TaxID=47882 RepID=A0A1I1T1A8_PSEOC|nr:MULTISPECIES: TonB-dependent siderophore receptor [Pseudomonas]TWE05675.1 iron complex outermembrane receptor protein [Pseudomonas sp. AG1028]GLX12749.1 ferrioxamine receptor FoxA [Pseudomonas straminea]SFD52391.1 iron complex outermembrane recepter protein [Pseudomonas straminea]